MHPSQAALVRAASMKFTYDERVEDGLYAAHALADFPRMVEHPDEEPGGRVMSSWTTRLLVGAGVVVVLVAGGIAHLVFSDSATPVDVEDAVERPGRGTHHRC